MRVQLIEDHCTYVAEIRRSFWLKREVAHLSGPFRTFLTARALNVSDPLVAKPADKRGHAQLAGFVGLDGPARVVGGQKGAACDAAGRGQGNQALRAHAEVQNDVLFSVPEAAVGGLV